jgi:hypothetical protein
MTIDTGFARGTACVVAGAIFVAAAIRQAALIVPAAATVADVHIRAAQAGQAGRSGHTAGVTAGVGCGAA